MSRLVIVWIREYSLEHLPHILPKGGALVSVEDFGSKLVCLKFILPVETIKILDLHSEPLWTFSSSVEHPSVSPEWSCFIFFNQSSQMLLASSEPRPCTFSPVDRTFTNPGALSTLNAVRDVLFLARNSFLSFFFTAARQTVAPLAVLILPRISIT